MKDEDTWQPPIGPREVKCHKCCWWVEFHFVSYRGVFEDAEDPRQDVDTVTDCWWCYMRRMKACGVEFTERLKAMFRGLRGAKRGDRVAGWGEAKGWRSMGGDSGGGGGCCSRVK